MSAGQFKTVRYQDDYGLISPIVIQPETETLSFGADTNTGIVAAATNKYRVRAGGGRREIGCRARLVGIKITDGTPPVDYKPGGIIYLPWLDPSSYANLAKGMVGSYTIRGTSYEVTISGLIKEAGAM